MEIKTTWQGFDQLEADFQTLTKGMQGQALRAALRAAASPVLKSAKADSPSRRIRKGLTVSVQGNNARAVAKIGPRKRTQAAKILHLVEGPTRPHTIRPKRKKIMFWKKSFGTVVHHPGTRGRPFFRRQLPDHRADAEAAFANAFRKIISSMQLRLLKRALRG